MSYFKACGLVKNLALMTHITTEVDEFPLIRLANNTGVIDLNTVSGDFMNAPDVYVVFLNGCIIGLVKNYKRLIGWFRLMRRNGFISGYVSIYPNHMHRCVYISSDGGRLCRPYIIVDKGQPLIRPEHIHELQMGLKTFEDFIHDGECYIVRCIGVLSADIILIRDYIG